MFILGLFGVCTSKNENERGRARARESERVPVEMLLECKSVGELGAPPFRFVCRTLLGFAGKEKYLERHRTSSSTKAKQPLRGDFQWSQTKGQLGLFHLHQWAGAGGAGAIAVEVAMNPELGRNEELRSLMTAESLC